MGKIDAPWNANNLIWLIPSLFIIISIRPDWWIKGLEYKNFKWDPWVQSLAPHGPLRSSPWTLLSVNLEQNKIETKIECSNEQPSHWQLFSNCECSFSHREWWSEMLLSFLVSVCVFSGMGIGRENHAMIFRPDCITIVANATVISGLGSCIW